MTAMIGIIGLVLGSSLPLLRISHGSVLNVRARRRTKNTRKGNTNRIETMQKAQTLDCVFGPGAITEHSWHCCKIKKRSQKPWLMLTHNDFSNDVGPDDL